MSEQSVLVTGAAGFIGRHVARAFLSAGYRVTTVDLTTPPADLCRDTTVHTGSFDDPAVLGAVAAGRFTAVAHLGAISSTVEDNWPALEQTNITGPAALADACDRSGTRFVYASSSSVYGEIAERRPLPESALGSAACSGPLNAYARSKARFDTHMSTRFTAGGGPGWAGLRFTNVFGTGERHKKAMASIIGQLLLATARHEPLTLFADTLEACRDYIPVATVARTCVLMADPTAPRGVFNLGSGHATSFAELLRWCAEFTDSPLNVRLVPNPHIGRYQYWTCADMSALDASLPARPRPGPGDLRDAAHELYRHFTHTNDRS
ncbi:NAD-dependent epimerase/dehydratase family protein [Streptomyces xanthochromogenes]|uniref:ADP-L-glycero-D-manno-heptose-6-epimerase n=1 Tax=Streptomyces xanthochromogenes TaxID=67384 RepID=A0ABQ3AN47_9ACTN|nr:NAD-dependent epimerase/dehydratase family protein [Streptomyces xanthochromogenes]GGY58254.1 ADP-L-glycero-D-manno-heptose-6-epimerase [Streptomyces xanthochromogenes]